MTVSLHYLFQVNNMPTVVVIALSTAKNPVIRGGLIRNRIASPFFAIPVSKVHASSSQDTVTAFFSTHAAAKSGGGGSSSWTGRKNLTDFTSWETVSSIPRGEKGDDNWSKLAIFAAACFKRKKLHSDVFKYTLDKSWNTLYSIHYVLLITLSPDKLNIHSIPLSPPNDEWGHCAQTLPANWL